MKQLIGIFALLASTSIIAQEVDLQKGEQLFQQNCSSCHKLNKVMIGPPLKGVAEKYGDLEYLTGFVHNSQEMIASGDERAVAIFEEYNKQVMTSFPDLTQNDVQAILAYADSEVADETTTVGVKIRPLEPQPVSGARPLYFKQNFGLWALYFFGVLVLLGFLIQIVTVNDLLPYLKKDDDKAQL